MPCSITHSHVDHLNRWSLRALDRDTHLVVPRGCKADRRGSRVRAGHRGHRRRSARDRRARRSRRSRRATTTAAGASATSPECVGYVVARRRRRRSITPATSTSRITRVFDDDRQAVRDRRDAVADRRDDAGLVLPDAPHSGSIRASTSIPTARSTSTSGSVRERWCRCTGGRCTCGSACRRCRGAGSRRSRSPAMPRGFISSSTARASTSQKLAVEPAPGSVHHNCMLALRWSLATDSFAVVLVALLGTATLVAPHRRHHALAPVVHHRGADRCRARGPQSRRRSFMSRRRARMRSSCTSTRVRSRGVRAALCRARRGSTRAALRSTRARVGSRERRPMRRQETKFEALRYARAAGSLARRKATPTSSMRVFARPRRSHAAAYAAERNDEGRELALTTCDALGVPLAATKRARSRSIS